MSRIGDTAHIIWVGELGDRLGREIECGDVHRNAVLDAQQRVIASSRLDRTASRNGSIFEDRLLVFRDA
jgi:hypothetical protein